MENPVDNVEKYVDNSLAVDNVEKPDLFSTHNAQPGESLRKRMKSRFPQYEQPLL